MSSTEPVGTIRTLWRFPVKSMLGEELDTVDLSESGITGDRAYAVRDRETGKIASARRGGTRSRPHQPPEMDPPRRGKTHRPHARTRTIALITFDDAGARDASSRLTAVAGRHVVTVLWVLL